MLKQIRELEDEVKLKADSARSTTPATATTVSTTSLVTPLSATPATVAMTTTSSVSTPAVTGSTTGDLHVLFSEFIGAQK